MSAEKTPQLNRTGDTRIAASGAGSPQFPQFPNLPQFPTPQGPDGHNESFHKPYPDAIEAALTIIDHARVSRRCNPVAGPLYGWTADGLETGIEISLCTVPYIHMLLMVQSIGYLTGTTCGVPWSLPSRIEAGKYEH
jgi:hypothetical protein